METKIYEKRVVQVVSLDENTVGYYDSQHKQPEPAYNSSVIEILEFIGDLPLREQVYMMSNMLTVSGYTQREISEVLGVAYKTYRNILLDTRKKLRDRELGPR